MLQKFETEFEWLAARAPNVNSTELAAMFGLSQYKSRFTLWCEKAGLNAPDFEDTPFTEWGKVLQVPVGMKLCKDRGWQGFDLTGYYLSCTALRLGASMDLRAVSDEGDGLLEIKVAERLSEEAGWTAAQAPVEYEFQIQGQMHSAIKDGQDIRWGGIGYLAQRQKSGVMHRLYDADLGKMIDIEVAEFWRSIVANEPPPPDYLADAALLEKLRGPLRDGDRIILTGNERAAQLLDSIRTLKELKKPLKSELKRIETEQKKAENEFLQLMGRNEIAYIGDYRVKAKIQKREDTVTYGSSFRRFDISKL